MRKRDLAEQSSGRRHQVQRLRRHSGLMQQFHEARGDKWGGLRRLGDDRVLFTLEEDSMRVFGVRHRSEAYK